MPGKPAEQGSSPAWDTERSNRILLILGGVLLVLIFMDVQARRHYEAVAGPDPAQYARDRLDQARDSLQAPVQATVDDIFRGAEETTELPAQWTEQARNQVGAAGHEALDRALELEGGAPATIAEDIGQGIRVRPLDRLSYTGDHIYLYFVRFTGQSTRLIRVQRSVADRRELTVSAVLTMLKEGPALRERGLINNFGASMQIRSVRLEGRIVYLDMDDSIGRMGNHVIKDRLDQIVYTLTQFSDVGGIQLSVNGQPVSTIGAGNYPVPEILQRGTREAFDYTGP